MLDAIALFISRLTFVQAQILIGEIFIGVALIIIVVALLPRLSNAKKINVKTGETEYYDDTPTPKRIHKPAVKK